MSKYTSPTFETKDFVDQELMIASDCRNCSLFQSTIIVRWKLNLKFDGLGIWSMAPEITWVQVIANFEPDEQPEDPQQQISGHVQNYNFTPNTDGWVVIVETQKAPNNEYRCTIAYVDVDSKTATIIFEY